MLPRPIATGLLLTAAFLLALGPSAVGAPVAAQTGSMSALSGRVGVTAQGIVTACVDGALTLEAAWFHADTRSAASGTRVSWFELSSGLVSASQEIEYSAPRGPSSGTLQLTIQPSSAVGWVTVSLEAKQSDSAVDGERHWESQAGATLRVLNVCA